MAQLARGAGAALDALIRDLRFVLSDLADGHEAAKRNPDLTRDRLDRASDVIRDVIDSLDTDMRDRLKRAENRAADRAVLDELLERVARLETER